MREYRITNGDVSYIVKASFVNDYGCIHLKDDEGTVAIVPKDTGFIVVEIQEETE